VVRSVESAVANSRRNISLTAPASRWSDLRSTRTRATWSLGRKRRADSATASLRSAAVNYRWIQRTRMVWWEAWGPGKVPRRIPGRLSWIHAVEWRAAACRRAAARRKNTAWGQAPALPRSVSV